MGRLEPTRKAPLLRVLGQQGTVGALYNVLETRREKALDRGHSLQEEKPDQFF
jgi:haloacetate dehalogenase